MTPARHQAGVPRRAPQLLIAGAKKMSAKVAEATAMIQAWKAKPTLRAMKKARTAPRVKRSHMAMPRLRDLSGDAFDEKTQAAICGTRTSAVKTKSMMKRMSQATRVWERGVHMRVPKDVMPSRRMWLAMPMA